MLEFRSFLHWRDAATEQHSCSDQETKKVHQLRCIEVRYYRLYCKLGKKHNATKILPAEYQVKNTSAEFKDTSCDLREDINCEVSKITDLEQRHGSLEVN